MRCSVMAKEPHAPGLTGLPNMLAGISPEPRAGIRALGEHMRAGRSDLRLGTIVSLQSSESGLHPIARRIERLPNGLTPCGTAPPSIHC